MSKRHCFRPPYESQHANRSEELLESTRQYFYGAFSSLCEKLSWKISLLVISEILELFVNTLTPNDKCFLCNSENLQ